MGRTSLALGGLFFFIFQQCVLMKLPAFSTHTQTSHVSQTNAYPVKPRYITQNFVIILNLLPNQNHNNKKQLCREFLFHSSTCDKGTTSLLAMDFLDKKAIKRRSRTVRVKRIVNSKTDQVAVNKEHAAAQVNNKLRRHVDVKESDDIKLLNKKRKGADYEMVQSFLSSLDKGLSTPRSRKETACFRMVELDDKDLKRIVGMKLKVYWPESGKWFQGSIRAFDDKKKVHEINYDDGDKEILNLNHEKFQLEIKPSDGFRIKTASHLKKEAKDSDDEVVIAEALKKHVKRKEVLKMKRKDSVSSQVTKEKMEGVVLPSDEANKIEDNESAFVAQVESVIDKQADLKSTKADFNSDILKKESGDNEENKVAKEAASDTSCEAVVTLPPAMPENSCLENPKTKRELESEEKDSPVEQDTDHGTMKDLGELESGFRCEDSDNTAERQETSS